MSRWIRKRVVLIAAAAAVVAAVTSVVVMQTARSKPSPDVTWLHAAALKVSQSMGEPNPAMQYALTTEGVAQAAMRLGSSPALDPAAPVYVVVLRGTFTRNRGPSDTSAVTGTTLALEFASRSDAAVNGPLAVSGTVDTSGLGALSSL